MPNHFVLDLRPKDGDWTKPLAAMVTAAGFLWGAWEFLFKEIIRPAMIPVSPITVALEIKRLKPGKAYGNAHPMLLTASVKNPKAKTLSIRKTFWVAHAIALTDSKESLKPIQTEDQLIEDVNRQMSLGNDTLTLEGTATSRYQRSNDQWQVIGFGPLLDSNSIYPYEELTAQRVILVPKLAPPEDFKLLRVRVLIPSYAERSNLADVDLIRVMGGITHPSKNFVQVGFCQAERNWRNHGIRWFFDKFALPQDRFDTVFREPASRYCPSLMTREQKEKVGAHVFVSTFEIPLDVAPEAGS